ncbi:uncharacterized protein P884DRAFT_332979 [Thermothelomyces heterothallicus CBS 202.75]|uniref:uncharacterized protein n=1 Tax=Thermothelomyces heterothallicus CBS 202.75 TaxID=1149848 RepID=UPI00374396C7
MIRRAGQVPPGDAAVTTESATTNPDHAPHNELLDLPRQQITRDGPSPDSETAPSPTRRRRRTKRREGLGDDIDSGGETHWRFPSAEVRFRYHLPWLVVRHKTTGKNFDSLVGQFRLWDNHMRAAFRRLDGSATEAPRASKSTRGILKTYERLLALKTVEEMRSSWLAIAPEKREQDWLYLMKAVVDFQPESAALVLEATVEPSTTPGWAVADVFAFLNRWSSTLPDDGRRHQQARLPGLLLHLLRNSPPNHYQFHQWALGQTLSVCEPDTAAEIYSALRRYNHYIHYNTKLKIAGRLTRGSKYKLAALRVFEEVLKDPHVDVNDRRCAALATELFTLPQSWKDGRESPVEVQLLAEAFERVVGLGLSPNVVTYTAMIRSLCLTNQLGTAWKIYDVMRSHGTTPDPHVFSILLNGAKLAISLDSTVRVVEEATPDTFRIPYFWNDIIHTILLAAAEEATSRPVMHGQPIAIPAFSSMLRVYAKFFRLEPLQGLVQTDLQEILAQDDDPGRQLELSWKQKLAVLVDQLPVSSPEELVEPGVDTLGIMLLGYIKSFSTPQPVLSFYSHFRKLLKSRDPIAIGLASHSTLPYDVVLKSLTDNPGMLRVGIDIVNDMLRDAAASAAALKARPAESDPTNPPAPPPTTSGPGAGPDAAEQQTDKATTSTATTITTTTSSSSSSSSAGGGEEEESESSLPTFHHPPPSVYTWSILLLAFSKQRNLREVERLIQAMRRHGVEPNRVTWNTLLTGHAKRGNERGVVAVVDRLDAARYHPDRYTVTAVGKLHRPERALTHLEERAAAREGERWAEVEEAAVVPEPGRSLWPPRPLVKKQGSSSSRGGGGEKVPLRLGKRIDKFRQRLAKERAELEAKMQQERQQAETALEKAKRAARETRSRVQEEEWTARARPPPLAEGGAGEGEEEEEEEEQASSTAGADGAGVSDAAVDSYLRMYDELVFMRTHNELREIKESIKEDQPPTVRRVQTEKGKYPPRWNSYARRPLGLSVGLERAEAETASDGTGTPTPPPDEAPASREEADDDHEDDKAAPESTRVERVAVELVEVWAVCLLLYVFLPQSLLSVTVML